uniref:Uncharacterized protein n=1 Tax=Populus trichocarpa TaxID=3694 RepID=A0A2K2CDW1_POPTR
MILEANYPVSILRERTSKNDGYNQEGRSIEAIPAPRHHVIEIISVRIHLMNWPLLTLYFR